MINKRGQMKQKFVVKLWSLSPSTEINQETLEVDAVDDLFLTSKIASDELGFQEQQRARMMISIQRRDNKEQGNTFDFKRSGKVMHKPTMGFYHSQLSRGTRSASSYEEPPPPSPADLQIRRRNPPRWPSPSAVVVHRLRSVLTVPFLFASIFHCKIVFMFYFLLGKLQDAIFSEIQTSSFISFRIEQSRAEHPLFMESPSSKQTPLLPLLVLEVIQLSRSSIFIPWSVKRFPTSLQPCMHFSRSTIHPLDPNKRQHQVWWISAPARRDLSVGNLTHPPKIILI